MLLVAIAWMYVVLMMALAEAFSTQGSVLGALMTIVLYGVVPLAIVMYLMGTPMRRQARRRAEALQAQADATDTASPAPVPVSAQADDGGHAAAAQSVDALVSERKEA